MVKPSTIFTGDNLPILRGMDSGSVDLIYLDPPFNSKRNYAAPIGSAAAGAEFKDTWTLEDTDVAWWGEIAEINPALYKVIDASGAAGGKSDKAYCIYMAVRLLEMKRVLKSTGSIYYHCDPTMSHSIKLVMDSIFGANSFRNEVIWAYKKWTNTINAFQRNNDNIFYYVKSGQATFNKLFGAPTLNQLALRERGYNAGSSGGTKILRVYDAEKAKHKIAEAKKLGVRIYYIDEPLPGEPLSSVWNLPLIGGGAAERQGYPTQKPLALLRRIIQASSNEGDLVLDPFCGCATACVAAQDERRDWIGIDISKKAYELIQRRFDKELGIFNPKIIHRMDLPRRADQQKRSKNIKHIRFGEQQGKCNGCKFEFQFRNFEVDHIVPLHKGGADSDENLQLLCGSCNRIKGEHDMNYLWAKLRKMGVIS